MHFLHRCAHMKYVQIIIIIVYLMPLCVVVRHT